MRKRLYEIIEVSQENDKVGMAYDVLMMCAIIISIIPLAFKETNTVFLCTDIITTVLFIIDYIFRVNVMKGMLFYCHGGGVHRINLTKT